MKKQDDKFNSNSKYLVKLLPAVVVAAAVVVSGVQGNADSSQSVKSQSSESMSDTDIGELISTAYAADTDIDTSSLSDGESGSTDKNSSKKSKKSVKKATAKALPDESAKTSSTGQGTTTTPTTSVPANGYKDGTYQGSATGFGGTITVQVTVSGGKIASIDIVSAPGETASYLASAKGVINKIISGQTPNVDVVSGATYSSNGIIGAVQNALSKAANNTSTTPTPTATPKKTSTSTSKNVKYKDGTYKGEAEGFDGQVKVTVTVKNGKITEIKNTNTDTKQYFDSAWNTIKPAILSNQSADDVDTVSGSTYSSNGILNAVKNALKNATVTVLPTAKPTLTPKATATPTSTPTPTPSVTETPSQDTDENSSDTITFKDGKYTGSGEGYAGTVSVTITIKDNRITRSTYDMGDDTSSYFQKAWLGTTRGGKYYTGIKAQVEAKMSADGIDTVSGATYSSKGIIEAYRNALSQAMIMPSVTPTVTPSATPTITPSATPILTPTVTPTDDAEKAATTNAASSEESTESSNENASAANSDANTDESISETAYDASETEQKSKTEKSEDQEKNDSDEKSEE